MFQELEIYYLAQLVRIYAVGLCVGGSTIAMTNYFVMVSRGHIGESERRMMHIVYRVLRIGMCLAVMTEITNIAYNYHINNYIYWTDNPEFFMRVTIFSVIIVNAVAMQFKKITMWLGPVFAGGSWYAYFFFSVWIETGSTYDVLLAGYLVWLVGVAAFLTLLRLFLTRKHASGMSNEVELSAEARV